MHVLDERVESLLSDLPDQQGARLFLERLQKENPRAYNNLNREPGVLSDALTLAAWSPLLGTTLEQNPDYISWLIRERTNPRVRTCDELKESLARFALTNSSVGTQVLLARFRRRELLRIYLHDIRRTHTLVETTEELSNLADAILDYALSLASQDLDNRYGPPRRKDDRGRSATAEFCIVALGKLGSHELNYASDIDLVFIYSDEGSTSGLGERGEVSNREYFIKLAETIAKLVGQPSGEGAAYRVDLRLRPHGRDGTLSCSLNEATRYYRENAQAWELQTLIRSRAAAGSASLFSRFAKSVQEQVFRKDVSVKEALASVRLAKQKIDKHIERKSGGFNVKLNRGGIREVEFIAQALQLAHGGNDEWLRAAHTLITLGRLGERNLITEQERTELSDAYSFLRTLEHRLQMEHGLQTHTIPIAPEQKALVARRMKFSGRTATEQLDRALQFHTSRVSKAYERVFGGAGPSDSRVESAPLKNAAQSEGVSRRELGPSVHTDRASAYAAASVFARHLVNISGEPQALDVESINLILEREALGSLNSHRALSFAARIASSLEKADDAIAISERSLVALVRLCGSSEFFGEMVASNPALITSMAAERGKNARRDFRSMLRSSITPENDFSTELSVLRRAWASLLLDIGIRDASGKISLFESNRLQTDLATASINVAHLIAKRELVRRYGRLDHKPRIAILALGRLASGGVDYGSDLDIIIVYDSFLPPPVSALSQEEAYARLGELMIAALASVTREGYLYRVDLRLRPDGQNGPLVASSQAFLDYLKERTVVWEWLAYVKLRAVGGDLDLGKMIETHARHALHEAARRNDPEGLRKETRHVRDRLEKEKGKQNRHRGIDVKYSAGGMLDVYFATRYLQLRDDVSDEGEDRSTATTLKRLRATDSLNEEDFTALSSGYALLRSVDHHLRLILGRQARLPAADHPALRDIASQLGFVSAVDLHEVLSETMKSIREAYLRITG
ncbi:bifunctional [glutamate--ammonia ligase]-adenylyl-L-tyrosine phosphorylase/[glutamate--ammonia-ligase] adenylyltransferase [soil metagenome]